MKKKKSMSTAQNARLEARVAPELKNLFMKAAKIQGTNLTNFIILSTKKEAESVLKQQTLINLSLRDELPSSRFKSSAERFKSLSR